MKTTPTANDQLHIVDALPRTAKAEIISQLWARGIHIAQWQPISTAPMDGTTILAWRDDYDVVMMRYCAPCDFLNDSEMDDEIDPFYNDWFYADFVHGGRVNDAPTHWMPLPPPPTTTNPNGL